METRGLAVRLLGPPEITVDGQVPEFRTRKTIALLLYLAAERGPHSRDRLAALLWPKLTPSEALSALDRTIGYLRDSLLVPGGRPGETYLPAGDPVGLDHAAGIEVDIDRVTAAARLLEDLGQQPPDEQDLAMLEDAARRCSDEFLAGVSLPDAPGFDAWISTQRAHYRQLCAAIRQRLAQLRAATSAAPEPSNPTSSQPS